MPTIFFPWKPNARGEPRPEVGARHERTLEGVGSSARFGADDWAPNRCTVTPGERKCYAPVRWAMRGRTSLAMRSIEWCQASLSPT